MNLLQKRKSGDVPALFNDLFNPRSIFDRDLFDFGMDLFPSRLGINIPTANLSENKKEYMVEIAVPGMNREDFNIEIENKTLIISAEKEEEKKEEEGGFSRKEYAFNSFCRTFALPENIVEDKIDAKYEDGILRINIPKRKETSVQPTKKITVS